MEDAMFEDTIQKCLAGIDDLPPAERERILILIEETRQRHACIQHSTRVALDALDDWRLRRKYELFAVEAKLREAQSGQHKSTDDEAD